MGAPTNNSTPPSNYGSTEVHQQTPDNLSAHLSTYTAGQDAGRLATLRKEFGLSRHRMPREQVRARVSDAFSTLNMESLKVRMCYDALWRGIICISSYCLHCCKIPIKAMGRTNGLTRQIIS